MVINARSQSRGFAYIEFTHLSDLMKALDLKEGEFRGRNFKISKSNREIGFKKPNRDMNNRLEMEGKEEKRDRGDGWKRR